MDSPSQQQATVTKKIQLSPHVYEFTFQVPHPIFFTPGQYVTFIIDGQTRRQYSFAAPYANNNQFTIVVDVTPMGPGSKFFLEKKEGDTVEVLAPLGTFHLFPPTGPIVFIATGTGIVPFRTMIDDYLQSGGKENMTLLWGLRHEEDIFWKELFDGWVGRYSNFHYTIVLSHPTGAWKGQTGHVTEHIQEEIHGIKTYIFYLCGNSHMIQDVKTDLLAHTIPEGQIKTEVF